MPKFLSMVCPACGAKLQFSEDEDRLLCNYCGTEQLLDGETRRRARAEIPKEAGEYTISQLKQLQDEVGDLEDQLAFTRKPTLAAIASIEIFRILNIFLIVPAGLAFLEFLTHLDPTFLEWNMYRVGVKWGALGLAFLIAFSVLQQSLAKLKAMREMPLKLEIQEAIDRKDVEIERYETMLFGTTRSSSTKRPRSRKPLSQEARRFVSERLEYLKAYIDIHQRLLASGDPPSVAKVVLTQSGILLVIIVVAALVLDAVQAGRIPLPEVLDFLDNPSVTWFVSAVLILFVYSRLWKCITTVEEALTEPRSHDELREILGKKRAEISAYEAYLMSSMQ